MYTFVWIGVHRTCKSQYRWMLRATRLSPFHFPLHPGSTCLRSETFHLCKTPQQCTHLSTSVYVGWKDGRSFESDVKAKDPTSTAKAQHFFQVWGERAASPRSSGLYMFFCFVECPNFWTWSWVQVDVGRRILLLSFHGGPTRKVNQTMIRDDFSTGGASAAPTIGSEGRDARHIHARACRWLRRGMRSEERRKSVWVNGCIEFGLVYGWLWGRGWMWVFGATGVAPLWCLRRIRLGAAVVGVTPSQSRGVAGGRRDQMRYICLEKWSFNLTGRLNHLRFCEWALCHQFPTGLAREIACMVEWGVYQKKTTCHGGGPYEGL